MFWGDGKGGGGEGGRRGRASFWAIKRTPDYYFSVSDHRKFDDDRWGSAAAGRWGCSSS